jgi:hypothetical protein
MHGDGQRRSEGQEEWETGSTATIPMSLGQRFRLFRAFTAEDFHPYPSGNLPAQHPKMSQEWTWIVHALGPENIGG